MQRKIDCTRTIVIQIINELIDMKTFDVTTKIHDPFMFLHYCYCYYYEQLRFCQWLINYGLINKRITLDDTYIYFIRVSIARWKQFYLNKNIRRVSYDSCVVVFLYICYDNIKLPVFKICIYVNGKYYFDPV